MMLLIENAKDRQVFKAVLNEKEIEFEALVGLIKDRCGKSNMKIIMEEL